MMIQIGFGGMVNMNHVTAILPGLDSAPVRRMVQEAKENGILIDATYGRKTRSVIVMDTNQVVLSSVGIEAMQRRTEEAG